MVFIIKNKLNINNMFPSEDEEEEDFSKGMHTFIDKVKTRRMVTRSHKLQNMKKISSVVGAESRVVAAATYEKTYV